MKNKIYFLIPFVQILLIIFASCCFITETNDSKSYYSIAANLPKISDSLFPILYPSFLKLLYFFIHNFFIASKIINIIFLVLFFFLTKKYLEEWKLIWLFSLSWLFLPILAYSWSEILLIPQLSLLFILQRKYWNNEVSKSNVLNFLNSTLLFSLFLTKYSMLYVIIGTFFFGMLMYSYTKEKKFLFFIYSSFIASFFCGIYLYGNYFFTGYYIGNREALGEISTNSRLSLFNTLQSINPFFGSSFGRPPYFLVVIIFIFLSIIYTTRIFIIWKKKKIENLYFIFLGFVYLILLWISYFNTRIDVLSIRLLFPFCFLFFFGLISNNLKIKYLYHYKYFLLIAFVLQIIVSLNHTNQYY